MASRSQYFLIVSNQFTRFCRYSMKMGGRILLVLCMAFCHFSVFAEKKHRPRGYLHGDKLPPKTLYLTLDDGPSVHTRRILDILKDNNVKATFFVCAYRKYYKRHKRLRRHKNNFKRFSKTLHRIVDEGHSLGNHSVNHPAFGSISNKRIRKELQRNQKYMKNVLGSKYPPVELIRPPFGDPFLRRGKKRRRRVARVLNKLGYTIMWTRQFDSTDSYDWVPGEWREKTKRKKGRAYRQKVKRIKRLLKRRLKKGRSAVILFHDTHNTVIDILPSVIHYARKKGYRFDNIDNYIKWRYPGQRDVTGSTR